MNVLEIVFGAGNPVLAAVGAVRIDALEGAQACYNSLFDAAYASPAVSMPDRRCLAFEVADAQGSTLLGVIYGAAVYGDDPRAFRPCHDTEPSRSLEAMVEFATLAAVSPAAVAKNEIQSLLAIGLTEAHIVVVSQIHAFVSYQVRLVSGMQALTGAIASSPVDRRTKMRDIPVKPVQLTSTLHASSQEPFTLTPLDWIPRIPPVVLSEATPEQLAALSANGGSLRTTNYSRVLAHDPSVLRNRSLLYDRIMYAKGGLPRPEREFAALRVSLINGCRYCASVHGRRLGQLTNDESWVERLIGDWRLEDLSKRQRAIDALATSLTTAPGVPPEQSVRGLLREGLDVIEVFDLINVVAMFAWANRLMQTLGDYRPATAAKASGVL